MSYLVISGFGSASVRIWRGRKSLSTISKSFCSNGGERNRLLLLPFQKATVQVSSLLCEGRALYLFLNQNVSHFPQVWLARTPYTYVRYALHENLLSQVQKKRRSPLMFLLIISYPISRDKIYCPLQLQPSCRFLHRTGKREVKSSSCRRGKENWAVNDMGILLH